VRERLVVRQILEFDSDRETAADVGLNLQRNRAAHDVCITAYADRHPVDQAVEAGRKRQGADSGAFSEPTADLRTCHLVRRKRDRRFVIDRRGIVFEEQFRADAAVQILVAVVPHQMEQSARLRRTDSDVAVTPHA